jgi:hypothetical protein
MHLLARAGKTPSGILLSIGGKSFPQNHYLVGSPVHTECWKALKIIKPIFFNELRQFLFSRARRKAREMWHPDCDPSLCHLDHLTLF